MNGFRVAGNAPVGWWAGVRVCALIATLLFISLERAEARTDAPSLTVTAPFLALSAGPGRGYPTLHAVAEGDRLALVKRRTDWVKVRDVDGRGGWIHRTALRAGVAGLRDSGVGQRGYAIARPHFAVLSGDFGGAASVGGFVALALSPKVSVRASGSQLLGRFSDGWTAHADLVFQPLPEWRVSPYVMLGGGVLQVDPQTTLVAPQGRRNDVAHVGVGLRGFLGRRLALTVEYESFQVFTARDDNQEIRRWQLGFTAHL